MRAAGALAALLLAACGGAEGAATPREALDSLRTALVAGDGARFVRLLDTESASRGKAEVRERRALIARGDDPAKVLEGLPLTVEELNRGDEADTIALYFPRRSPLFQDAERLAKASIVEEQQDGADAAAFDLKADDGVVRRLWFAKELGAWRFDNLRTRKDWN